MFFRPFLLLELARFCLELDFPDLAQDCVDQMKNSNVKVKSLSCYLNTDNKLTM
jgi:hypothetical protein